MERVIERNPWDGSPALTLPQKFVASPLGRWRRSTHVNSPPLPPAGQFPDFPIKPQRSSHTISSLLLPSRAAPPSVPHRAHAAESAQETPPPPPRGDEVERPDAVRAAVCPVAGERVVGSHISAEVPLPRLPCHHRPRTTASVRTDVCLRAGRIVYGRTPATGKRQAGEIAVGRYRGRWVDSSV